MQRVFKDNISLKREYHHQSKLQSYRCNTIKFLYECIFKVFFAFFPDYDQPCEQSGRQRNNNKKYD